MDSDIKISPDHTAPDPLQQRVNIDLYEDKRNLTPVGKIWTIVVEPNPNLFKKIFGMTPKINREVILAVKNISESTGKLRFNSEKLISLIVDGHETVMNSDALVDMRLTSKSTSLSMFFHPEEIFDCEEVMTANSQIYKIKFDLIVADKRDGHIICSQPVNISVKLVPSTHTPLVQVSVPNEIVVYSKDMGVEQIGTIEIENVADRLFSPKIDCECELNVMRDGKRVDSNTIFLDFTAVKCKAAIEQDSSHKFRILGLDTKAHTERGGQIARIPLMADVQRIGNPANTAEGKAAFDITLRVKYNNSCTPTQIEQRDDQATFTLKHNAQQPSLTVTLTDPITGITREIDNGANLTLELIHFLPGQNLIAEPKLHLINNATDGKRGSGVYIRNLEANVAYPKGIKIVHSTKDMLPPIELANADDEIALPNQPDSSRDLSIAFYSNRLKELYTLKDKGMRNYNVRAVINIDFDYLLDERGRNVQPGYFEDNKEHFSCSITLPLYQEPNPDWLAIDFGTSAIVSQLGKKLIDLHAEKDKLYSASDLELDHYEEGTPFLSSNLVFRDVANPEPKSQLSTEDDNVADFSKLAVCLSPTTETEKSNIYNVIPYLKLIVGYDLLPNIENYTNFQYYCTDNGSDPAIQRVGLCKRETNEDNDEVVTYTPLARVDKVFEEVYNELFTYFISKAIAKDARKVNQLVLTIPNTYTPTHTERIEKIVRNALNDINIRNVKFVSESDAVACYYQKHWAEINRAYGREGDESLRQHENVLVYDMGAGTLDVTLFTKDVVDGRLTIKVIGKNGIAKAGNYLDCLLANILVSEFPAIAKFADPTKIEGDYLVEAFKLKDFVKHTLKPALSSGQNTLLIPRRREWKMTTDQTIDIDKVVLSHPDFVKYVQDCTGNFIRNFRNFFSGTDIKIDTVLLSGRSSKLKPLQEALHSVLQDWGTLNMKIIEISSLTGKNDRFDKAKTIVTEGAIDYASLFGREGSSFDFVSDNITANYGVFFDNIHGDTQYVELLNPRRDAPAKKVRTGGMLIKTYNGSEVIVDLSAATSLRLVQSYSQRPEEQWKKGEREYITVMAEFDVRSIPNRGNSKLRIIVDENNSLYLSINGMRSQPTNTSKIDINSKSNRMSLWPVMKAQEID